MPRPTDVSKEEYEDSVEHHMGWCVTCEEFTRGMCEPDAHDYDCPNCEQNNVFGAEEAVLREFICVIPFADEHGWKVDSERKD